MELAKNVKYRLLGKKMDYVRRTYIPKSNGKMRPPGICSIWDKLAEKCIQLVIEPYCETKFVPSFFGFYSVRIRGGMPVNREALELTAKSEEPGTTLGIFSASFNDSSEEYELAFYWPTNEQMNRIPAGGAVEILKHHLHRLPAL